ncbi:hypothetical protein COO91_01774 [Nostoc flagelliforme CCNUN1]|uniref:Uncharacterized protein n=1 Tax=Nostoc flagelliforme CCNUN1 TaxID=2038116 RepID=A0A2K8SKB6_9NOSO|nr:hypothetical protein COO91_01774 [Nostoc flagelliforme CCNUN1]
MQIAIWLKVFNDTNKANLCRLKVKTSLHYLNFAYIAYKLAQLKHY